MAYRTHTKSPIGSFVEKDTGNVFEYSVNNDALMFCEDLPHKVWVGDVVGHGYRYAIVKKTVAYVAVDEDVNGLPVLEKWELRNNREYVIQ